MHRGQQHECCCSARYLPTSTPPAARAPGSSRSRPDAGTRDREELRRSVRSGGAAKRTDGAAVAAASAVDAVAAVAAVAVCRQGGIAIHDCPGVAAVAAVAGVEQRNTLAAGAAGTSDAVHAGGIAAGPAGTAPREVNPGQPGEALAAGTARSSRPAGAVGGPAGPAGTALREVDPGQGGEALAAGTAGTADT